MPISLIGCSHAEATSLSPGDTVRVIAPSSPFDPVLAWRGLGWLAGEFDVQFSRGLFERREYLAGDDDRRLEELSKALEAPNVRAIIAMRGGYGSGRIAHRIDWHLLRGDPKWLVGFSDVTALHVEAQRVGVMSIHGSMIAQLGRGFHRLRESWLNTLRFPERPRVFRGLVPLAMGCGSGPVIGGNLTVLHASATSGRFRTPHGGAILFLEEVGERPYRIDRMLTSLLVGGHLQGIRGVLLGQFSSCHGASDDRSVEDVVREVLQEIKVPIVSGLPMGHELWNESLVLGATAVLEVRGDGGTLSLTP